MIDDSFMRVLGISLGESVPDVTTIRKFREMLATAGRVKGVFKKFDIYLRAHEFQAMRGQIIDVGIVSVPKQHNSRRENSQFLIFREIPMRKRGDTYVGVGGYFYFHIKRATISKVQGSPVPLLRGGSLCESLRPR